MLCEILEEIGLIVLELKFLKNRIEEEEANRVTYGGALFSKIQVTLNRDYSALWEKNLMKLMYFIIQGPVYTILEDLRNRDNTGPTCSKTVQIVLKKEHFDSCTAPHLLCIFGTRETNHNQ